MNQKLQLLPYHWLVYNSWVENVYGADTQDLQTYHPMASIAAGDTSHLLSSVFKLDKNNKCYLELEVTTSGYNGARWKDKTQKIFKLSRFYMIDNSLLEANRVEIPNKGIDSFTHVTLSIKYRAANNREVYTTEALWEEISSEEENKVLQNKTTSYTWIR
ncbi:MAG: hypothetical protein ABJK64_10230 [Paraglaciecola sp.]|uniref:hypothetical protein n=1 Tax=Paraglaciecola sp. TaxID=1920173 RepID=UPI003299B92F